MRKPQAVLLLALVAFMSLFCGCIASRISGRYGDGTAYDGINGIKIYRKFHIRSLKEVYNNGKHSFASSNVLEAISAMVPDMFNAEASPLDIPVDVVVYWNEQYEKYGEWSSIPYFCTLFVFPRWFEDELLCRITIMVDGAGQDLSGACKISSSSHCSILPWGWIPYHDKDGYQENLCDVGDYVEQAEVIRRTYAKCIAQQLKLHALDMLMTPDVDFAPEGNGQTIP